MREKPLRETMKLAGKPLDQESSRWGIEPGLLDDCAHEQRGSQPADSGRLALRAATELLIDLIFEKEVTHAA